VIRHGLLASVTAGNKRSRRATVGTPPVGGSVAASITAPRTSGPAPFATTFDATQSLRAGWTQAEVFRNCTFTFEVLGETGTYATTGLDKYVQEGGPVAGFILPDAGTYTVRVTVIDGLGNSDTAEIEVEAISADTYFAGTNTVCVSTSGNFTGAPSGSTHVTGSSAGTIVSGKRYLYRCGETFGNVQLPFGVTDTMFSDFGSGAKPVVPQIRAAESSSLSTWPHTCVIANLSIQFIDFNTCTRRITVYNNTMTGAAVADGKITFGGALGFYLDNGSQANSAFYWPEELCVFENTILGDTSNDSTPNVCVYGYFVKSSIAGNDVDRADEHTMRIFLSRETFVGHNDLGGDHYVDAPGPAGIRSALKLQSNGVTTSYAGNLGAGAGTASVNTVIADNIFGSLAFPGSWIVGIGPENTDATTAQGIQDLVYERNIHVRGDYTSQDLHVCGKRITTRDNTISGGGTFGGDAVTSAEYPTGGSGRDEMIANWCGPYYGELV
jgi:hypothetical protein